MTDIRCRSRSTGQIMLFKRLDDYAKMLRSVLVLHLPPDAQPGMVMVHSDVWANWNGEEWRDICYRKPLRFEPTHYYSQYHEADVRIMSEAVK